jgi:hypothetical protein
VEIAISILAEIVQHHRGDKTLEAEPAVATVTPTEAIDPICGMTVEIATARHRSEAGGRDVFLLCRLQGDVRTGELIYCRALFGALAPPPRRRARPPALDRSRGRGWFARAPCPSPRARRRGIRPRLLPPDPE